MTFSEPLATRWTLAGGHRTFVRYAPGPSEAVPLVLVHGLIVTSRYLVPTAERLAGRHPVHVPDLPGFGRSEKPPEALPIPALAEALGDFLETERLAPAVLIGNSMGCQVIAELAARHPELAARLVLIAPSVDPAARSALRQAGRLLLDEPLERPGMIADQARGLIEMGPRRAWQTIRHMLADRIEEKLPRIAAPALVVCGARDPIVPQRWAEEAARLLPRGRLVVIPGAAHGTNHHAPEALVRHIEAFLAEPA